MKSYKHKMNRNKLDRLKCHTMMNQHMMLRKSSNILFVLYYDYENYLFQAK
jgi:hypothetical protein